MISVLVVSGEVWSVAGTLQEESSTTARAYFSTQHEELVAMDHENATLSFIIRSLSCLKPLAFSFLFFLRVIHNLDYKNSLIGPLYC